MARTPSKDRISTIAIGTIKEIGDWISTLETHGFEIVSFQYNGEGRIRSATCVKNHEDQVVTPEIKQLLESTSKAARTPAST